MMPRFHGLSFKLTDGETGKEISLVGGVGEFSLNTINLPCLQDIQIEALSRKLDAQGCR